MRARTVRTHHEQRLATEQEWFAENQDVIRTSLRNGIDIPTLRQQAHSKMQLRTRDLCREAPLPSHLFIQCAMRAAVTAKREQPKPKLGAMLQRVLDLATPRQGSLPTLSLRWGNFAMDMCSAAEPTFASAVRQVPGGKFSREPKQGLKHNQLSVYHDESGVPLLFRKHINMSTAMLLQAVTVGDDAIGVVTLPPGTIVSPYNSKLMKEQTPSAETGQATIEPYTAVHTYQIDPSTFGITPLRLSPWVHTEDVDRALFSLETPRIGEGRADFQHQRWNSYKDIRLEHFHEAANRIMEICGVATAQSAPGSELVAS